MAVAPVQLPESAERRGQAAVRILATLPGGACTGVYAAAFEIALTDVRLVAMPHPHPLRSWCARTGVQDAIVGGFFLRGSGEPLGELRTRGTRRRSVPFDAPWGALRSCISAEGGDVRIAPREELPGAPRGDLLQAGPLLVREGRSLVVDGVDLEGFSAGRRQFDSDITRGRHPRAALGVGSGLVWAVACDGRSDEDAGMTLAELADYMVRLGVESAINLDGGGSTSLVLGGQLVNRPRDQHGAPAHGGRPISTALAFVRHGPVTK